MLDVFSGSGNRLRMHRWSGATQPGRWRPRLKQLYPLIQGPPAQHICYATENRQMAVKGVAEHCDLLLVVGSQNSSNSKRLVVVSANAGARAYLVNESINMECRGYR